MLLVILAAGKGFRLGKITEEVPKPLVRLSDGKSIIDKQIQAAISTNFIDEIVVVTGYKAEKIEKKVKVYKENIKISTVYNPFYTNAGPVVSLWVASNRMAESDFIIVNGDTIYTSKLYDSIDSSSHQSSIQLVVSSKKSYDHDDVKVKMDIENNIVQVRKGLLKGHFNACSAGFLVVRGLEKRRSFSTKLYNIIRLNDNLSPKEPWHDIVNGLAAEGSTIKGVIVDSSEWKEIDNIYDLEYCNEIGI